MVPQGTKMDFSQISQNLFNNFFCFTQIASLGYHISAMKSGTPLNRPKGVPQPPIRPPRMRKNDNFHTFCQIFEICLVTYFCSTHTDSLGCTLSAIKNWTPLNHSKGCLFSHSLSIVSESVHQQLFSFHGYSF